MSTISIDIPDAQATRILNSFAAAQGYQAQVPDLALAGVFIPNPEGKAAFAKRKVAEWVKNQVTAAESAAAAKSARDTAEQSAATLAIT